MIIGLTASIGCALGVVLWLWRMISFTEKEDADEVPSLMDGIMNGDDCGGSNRRQDAVIAFLAPLRPALPWIAALFAISVIPVLVGKVIYACIK